MNNLFPKESMPSVTKSVEFIIESIKQKDIETIKSLAENDFYNDFIVFVDEKEVQFVTDIIPADFTYDKKGSNTTDTKYKISLLHLAVQTKVPSKIEVLLLYGADPNETTDYGITPLILACALDCPKSLIQVFLSWGVQVNASTSWGWTALHYASWLANDEVIGVLMQYFADPYAVDFKGRSPLHLAVEKGSLRSVLKFMNFGTDPTAARRTDGATALHQAVAIGYWTIVEEMIEHNADINEVYRKGKLDLDMFNLTKTELEMCHQVLEKFARQKNNWLTRIFSSLKIWLFGSRSSTFYKQLKINDLKNL